MPFLGAEKGIESFFYVSRENIAEKKKSPENGISGRNSMLSIPVVPTTGQRSILKKLYAKK
jgi:hypothetical protein